MFSSLIFVEVMRRCGNLDLRNGMLRIQLQLFAVPKDGSKVRNEVSSMIFFVLCLQNLFFDRLVSTLLFHHLRFSSSCSSSMMFVLLIALPVLLSRRDLSFCPLLLTISIHHFPCPSPTPLLKILSIFLFFIYYIYMNL